jgi:hypothetical protein
VAFHTLEIEDEYDFEIIGVSSHEKDYRLAWSLNKSMGWRLVRIEDAVAEGKRSTTYHARFRWTHPVDQTVFTLIDNKTPEGTFMPDLAQFDYILKIEQPAEESMNRLLAGLRQSDFVLTFQRQEVDKLKFKDNLLDENR